MMMAMGDEDGGQDEDEDENEGEDDNDSMMIPIQSFKINARINVLE